MFSWFSRCCSSFSYSYFSSQSFLCVSCFLATTLVLVRPVVIRTFLLGSMVVEVDQVLFVFCVAVLYSMALLCHEVACFSVVISSAPFACGVRSALSLRRFGALSVVVFLSGAS